MDISLKNMSVREKLQLIEVIWDDLLDSKRDIPSPEWHSEVLTEREAKYGAEANIDWETAKAELLRLIR